MLPLAFAPTKAALVCGRGFGDQIYQAEIVPRGNAYDVEVAYGRRGCALTPGSRTEEPVDYQTAQQLFYALLREKLALGYIAARQDAIDQQAGESMPALEVMPQLLNPIDEANAQRLIHCDAWWTQEKFDGRRVLIRKEGNITQGFNRRGAPIELPASIASAVGCLKSECCLLDGEVVGASYFAFDLLRSGDDLVELPYYARLGRLNDLIDRCVIRDWGKHLRAADTAIGTDRKRTMLEQLRALKREGIVFKHSMAPHSPGRPGSGGDQLKLKFTSTCCCLACGTNGQRSINLELTSYGRQIIVGNVTIPTEKPLPKEGDVVEVRYLYAHRDGRLHLPVYVRLRKDKTSRACTADQLLYRSVDR